MTRAVGRASLLVAGLLLTIACATAAGGGSAPCQISLGGVDVSSGHPRVEAPASGDLPFRILSPQATVHWSVRLHYAGLTIPALEQDYPRDGASERQGNVSVAAVARYGTGLYEVTGEATLDGGGSCPVALLLHVPGSPLRSVLGLAAVALLGVGGAGLVAMLAKGAMDANDARQMVQDFLVAAKDARKEAHEAMTQAPGQGRPPAG